MEEFGLCYMYIFGYVEYHLRSHLRVFSLLLHCVHFKATNCPFKCGYSCVTYVLMLLIYIYLFENTSF